MPLCSAPSAFQHCPGCLVLLSPQAALLPEAVKVVRTPQIPPGEHRRVRVQLLMCEMAALGMKCPQSMGAHHHLAHRAPPRPVLSSSFPFSHLTLRKRQGCPSLLAHSELLTKEAQSRGSLAPAECFLVHTQSWEAGWAQRDTGWRIVPG